MRCFLSGAKENTENDMVKLGFHVSIAGSFDLAVERAKALSCDTFQMFTRSPRVWAAKPISDGAAISFKRNTITIESTAPYILVVNGEEHSIGKGVSQVWLTNK